MTTIRDRSDDQPAEAPLAHLVPGRLRPRRLAGRAVLWMVPAAAGLAGLIVFGLDLIGGTDDAVQLARVEASAKPAPGSTGPLNRPAHRADRAAALPAGPAASPGAPVRPRPDERAGPAAPAALASLKPGGDSRIAAAPPPPAPDSRAPTPREPRQPPALKLSAEEVAALLTRGEDKLKRGELAAARLYFERVALAGDQRGAHGMARTYDPGVLAGLPVLGSHADAAAARHWYQRAETQSAAR